MHHGFFWPCSAFFWPCDLCDFEFFRNHWFTMDTADRRKHLCDKDRVGTQLKNNSADILIIWDALLTYLNSQIYTSCSSPQTCECAIWVSCSFGLSMHFLWLLAIKNSFFLNAERHLEILFFSRLLLFSLRSFSGPLVSVVLLRTSCSRISYGLVLLFGWLFAAVCLISGSLASFLLFFLLLFVLSFLLPFLLSTWFVTLWKSNINKI